MEEMLILVDSDDNSTGWEEKIPVHQKGLLHRAFSIFIFDNNGRLLLQKRANNKYHSAGLWTNSCCGHPRKGESTDAAAIRRLKEEMGFSTNLTKVSCFTYYAEVTGNLIEHEFDHIYAGLFNDDPSVNPDEAADWIWIDIPQLVYKTQRNPECFTVWFLTIINEMKSTELENWFKKVFR